MLPYLLIVVLTLALLASGSIRSRQIGWLATLIYAISLTIFSGVRYNVGIDYSNYLYLIDLILQGGTSHFEPGFTLLIKILGLVFQSSEHVAFIVFFICSTATIFLFYRFVRDNSKDPELSLALFALLPVFYLASFNAIRNFVAIAIFAYSLKYVVQGRVFPYIALISFAAMFHKSALILFPLYWYLRITPNPWMYLAGFGFMLALSKISILWDTIYSLVGLSEIYLRSSSDHKSSYLSFFLIPMFGLLLAFLWRRRRKYQISVHLNLFYIAVLLVFFQMQMSSLDPKLIYRLTGYFTISLLILIPFLIERFVSEERTFTRFVVVSVAMGYFLLVLTIKGDQYQLVPYQTFL
jgi:hypothetical protein